MKSKILFSALLAFALVLSSCGMIKFGTGTETEAVTKTEGAESTAEASGTGDPSVTSDKGETEEPYTVADKARERVGKLSNYDFRGQNFIIATTSGMTFATDGDEYYDRVLLLRDSIVEEKYGIDIITISAAYSEIEQELRNAELSGDYYADLISVPEYRIGRLAVNGLIMNLRSLPFYGTVSSYSRNSSAAYAGNAIYADIGAASSDFSSIYAVFFNRSAAESLGYDLDKMVEDNEWTWDTFDRLARMASERLGIVGQGSYSMGDEYTDVVFRSANIALVDNTLGRVPEIAFDSDALEATVELACSLIYGNPSAYKNTVSSGDDLYSLFGAGKLLFAIAPLREMERISAYNVDWGVLPIPKVDESQKHYYAYTEASANVLAVPLMNNKYEMTGILIGALNTASYELLAEEYKVNCLYSYFSSIKAMRSMDAVLDSMTFDFTYLYSAGTELLAEATYGAVREARKSSSAYATDIINERKDSANEELYELFGAKSFPEEELPIFPETDDVTEENENIETDIPEPEDSEAEIETETAEP